MLGSVKSALKLIESTIDEDRFDPAVDKRHFKMLLPDFIEAIVMPSLLKRLPENSQLTFEALGFSDLGDFRSAMSEGTVDIGIVPFLADETNLVYQHVRRDNYVLITRKGHPLLKHGFTWPLLRDLKFIVLSETLSKLGRLEEVLKTHSLTLDITYITHKLSSIPLLVSETSFVAFSGREYAKGLSRNWDIESYEIPGLGTFTQDVYLAHTKQADSDAGIKWLCEQIMLACQSEEAVDKVFPAV